VSRQGSNDISRVGGDRDGSLENTASGFVFDTTVEHSALNFESNGDIYLLKLERKLRTVNDQVSFDKLLNTDKTLRTLR